MGRGTSRNNAGHVKPCQICATERLSSVCRPKRGMQTPQEFMKFINSNMLEMQNNGKLEKIRNKYLSKEAI